MERLTITRALVELKTLDARIQKKISTFRPISILVGGKLPPGEGKTHEEFEQDAKADLQSIHALIQRRYDLKSAIVQSNATTIVTIHDESMTVAAAIDRKQAIALKKQLAQFLSSVHGQVVKKIEEMNHDVQRRLDVHLQSTFQKESSKVKSDEYDAVAKPFLANNEVKLLDPLKIERQITSLEEHISAFEQEVDVALSESNARTEIEI